jgi:hypothetical protein
MSINTEADECTYQEVKNQLAVLQESYHELEVRGEGINK